MKIVRKKMSSLHQYRVIGIILKIAVLYPIALNIKPYNKINQRFSYFLCEFFFSIVRNKSTHRRVNSG